MGKVSSWLRSKGLRRPAWHKEGFFPPSYEEEDKAAFIEINQHTLTDRERIIGLIQAVRYVEKAGIPGDIVECGVWKGGSMMVVARTLLNLGSTERQLYLFDTFEGMTEPTDLDASQEYGSAKEIWNRRKSEGSSWVRSPLDEVKRNMASVGYPEEHTVYIQGRVEDTLPAAAPESIAILRLDTDWYESTRHEMIHLFHVAGIADRGRRVPGGARNQDLPGAAVPRCEHLGEARRVGPATRIGSQRPPLCASACSIDSFMSGPIEASGCVSIICSMTARARGKSPRLA